MEKSRTGVEWLISSEMIPYQEAVTRMEERVEGITSGYTRELIWLLEHPSLYSAGTSASAEELLQPSRFPVYHSGRGGRYTYHGPGQRIVYVMLNLRSRGINVHRFIYDLESWLLSALARLGVTGTRLPGKVGIWVTRQDDCKCKEKIVAIGVRLRHWISFHGVAVNVNPNLEHFSGIVPCGLIGYGVTSLSAMGQAVTFRQVDQALYEAFFEIFSESPEQF